MKENLVFRNIKKRSLLSTCVCAHVCIHLLHGWAGEGVRVVMEDFSGVLTFKLRF